jgi:hypothetical protein
MGGRSQRLELADPAVVGGRVAFRDRLKPNTRCDADGPRGDPRWRMRRGQCHRPEAGESRLMPSRSIIHDYHGFAMASPAGIVKLDDAAVPGLQDYSAQVSVVPQALDGVAATDGTLVSVTIAGPAGTSLRLQLWRARVDR